MDLVIIISILLGVMFILFLLLFLFSAFTLNKLYDNQVEFAQENNKKEEKED